MSARRRARSPGYAHTSSRISLSASLSAVLAHVFGGGHAGLPRFRLPQWVWEGLPDYVGIENRESFEALRDALGDRPVEIPMLTKHGSSPRYRLLVTFFLERKGWSADQLLQT